MRIDFEAAGWTRSAVMAALRALVSGTQVHHIPVHRHPCWRRRYDDPALTGASLSKAMLSGAMADTNVDRVAAALEQVLS